MSRTRCVQFYWRKLCRLLRYSRSVQASRLIKEAMAQRARLILGQYRAFRFRRALTRHIQNKKAVVLQKILRKVLLRNRWTHYESNITKILRIQACFRMLKWRRKFRKHLRIRAQQERAVKSFERGYMALYNQKPSGRRKNKINRLLQE